MAAGGGFLGLLRRLVGRRAPRGASGGPPLLSYYATSGHFCLEGLGREPAVACIHGYCQSSAYWAPTVGRLAAAGVRALAPDLPGFGASAKAPGPYTMETYADGLAALLDARGIQRIMLVGGSMGGVVAQHFALRHPTRLVRLLLVATGAVMADPTAALAGAEARAAAPWDEAAVRPIVDGFFRQAPPPDRVAELRRIALSASHAAAIEAARSNARSRTVERLGEIRVPTLIIQGRHDRARTPEHGAVLRDAIPGARLAVLEQSGHTPQLEEPDAFHAIALPFLLEGRDGVRP
jgi:pimeloyl-ACP methyl ester carboxylesterase